MKSQDRWGCSPQDIERKIEEGKAEAEALEAQHLEVQRECEAVEQPVQGSTSRRWSRIRQTLSSSISRDAR